MGNRIASVLSRSQPITSTPTMEGTALGLAEVTSLDPKAYMMFDPVASGWELIERGLDCNIWFNRRTADEVQEYRVVANDEFEFNDNQTAFLLRFNSPILVASRFFKDESTSELCAAYYRGNLYLERIHLRLSDIDEIPYPDILHMYSQCFKGYAELFDAFGYFDVIEEMICVNKEGVVKVWINKTLDRHLPPVVYFNGTQRDMVLKVIRTISENTNQLTLPDRISDWIVRADPYTFKDAYASLQGFASKENTPIPEAMECVMNFMRMKYVESEEPELEEHFDMAMFESPRAVDGLIAQGVQNAIDEMVPLPSPLTGRIPHSSAAILIEEQPLIETTRRHRILRHKEPIIPVYVPGTLPRQIPVTSVVVSQQPIITQQVAFGRESIENVQTSQNPFSNILQGLQMPNHCQPKHSLQGVYTQPVTRWQPEKDRGMFSGAAATVIQRVPYVPPTVPPYYSPQPQPLTMTQPYKPSVESVSSHLTDMHKNEGSVAEGMTTTEMLAYIRSFRDVPKTQFIPGTQRGVPPETSSQYPNRAFSKNVENPSHVIDIVSQKVNQSITEKVTGRRLQIIEETRTYEQKSVRKSPEMKEGLMSIDEEVRRDLLKFRSSKASRGSRASGID